MIVEAGGFSKENEVIKTENSLSLFGLPATRSIKVGGTSTLWHGVLGRLNKIDFEPRENLNLPGWPITYDDLKDYYTEAEVELGVECFSLGDEKKVRQLLEKYSKDIDLDFTIFSNNLFRQKDPCIDFKNVIAEIKGKDNVVFLANHTALELKFDSTNTEVKYLVCGTKCGLKTVKADEYIVCCGALESPRLLLNSGVKNANLGQNLMDHPMGNLCQVKFLEPTLAPLYSDMQLSRGQKIKSGLGLSDFFLLKNDLVNHNFYFRPSFTPGINNKSDELKNKFLLIKSGKLKLKDFIDLALNMHVVIQILIYKLSLKIKFRYAEVFCVCEQLPNPANYVSLSSSVDPWGYKKSKIKWCYSDHEHTKLKDWFHRIQKYFPANQIMINTPLSAKTAFTSAAHHMGTCRMGHCPQKSVVDDNLRLHGVNNLYVCDGSVFPSGGNVNPGLTICALAIRLSKYLVMK